ATVLPFNTITARSRRTSVVATSRPPLRLGPAPGHQVLGQPLLHRPPRDAPGGANFQVGQLAFPHGLVQRRAADAVGPGHLGDSQGAILQQLQRTIQPVHLLPLLGLRCRPRPCYVQLSRVRCCNTTSFVLTFTRYMDKPKVVRWWAKQSGVGFETKGLNSWVTC